MGCWVMPEINSCLFSSSSLFLSPFWKTSDMTMAICVKKVEHLSKIILSLPITEQVNKHCNRVDWNGSVSLLYISNLLDKHIKLIFWPLRESKTKDLLE